MFNAEKSQLAMESPFIYRRFPWRLANPGGAFRQQAIGTTIPVPELFLPTWFTAAYWGII